MFGRQRRLGMAATVLGTCLLATALPATAGAHEAVSGGAAVVLDAEITSAACDADTAWRCQTGEALKLDGEGLQDAEKVRFAGGKTAEPESTSAHRVVVPVPSGAKTGPVRVVTTIGSATTPRPVKVVEGSGARAGGSGREVFPIKGRHDLGQSETNNFGGGRGHEGQDMFADCGTPLIAARDAKVSRATWHSAAGNYLVLTDDSGEALVYMHMRDKALVSVGDRVQAGDPVGFVGDTGRATGCHLHLEQWTAPGYYTGGRPQDPLPWLQSIDAGHAQRRHVAR